MSTVLVDKEQLYLSVRKLLNTNEYNFRTILSILYHQSLARCIELGLRFETVLHDQPTQQHEADVIQDITQLPTGCDRLIDTNGIGVWLTDIGVAYIELSRQLNDAINKINETLNIQTCSQYSEINKGFYLKYTRHDSTGISLNVMSNALELDLQQYAIDSENIVSKFITGLVRELLTTIQYHGTKTDIQVRNSLDIHKISNTIALNTRRGLANVLIANPTDRCAEQLASPIIESQLGLDSQSSPFINVKYSDAVGKGKILVGYRGQSNMDGGIFISIGHPIIKDGKFSIHSTVWVPSSYEPNPYWVVAELGEMQ